jgi:DNA-binding winged helix-turn-helix (wHTH) protein
MERADKAVTARAVKCEAQFSTVKRRITAIRKVLRWNAQKKGFIRTVEENKVSCKQKIQLRSIPTIIQNDEQERAG